MENRSKTAKLLEIFAMREGNNTHAGVDIDWSVSQIDGHCKCQLVNYYPRMLNCHHSIVASDIGHLLEPCLLTSVEIHLSSFSVNEDCCERVQMHDGM